MCGFVIRLNWRARLGVAEFLESVAHRDSRFAFINRAPSSASAADDITARIICEMLRTAPLFAGMSSFDDINMCPPARLRALGSDKYDASLWTARTMSLALYVSTASSWDAMKSKNDLHSFIVFAVG